MRRFLWVTFLVLDGLLIALFLTGYAARYLHPQHFWWTGLVAIGLPYLSVLLLLPALVVLLRRRWKLAGLHAALLLLVILRFVPMARLVPTANAAADPLTVMTFNVQKWGRYAPTEKLTRLMMLARAEQPDLICLQETLVQPRQATGGRGVAPHVAAVLDSLAYNLVHTDLRQGLTQPVLSRSQVLEQRQYVLPMPGDVGPVEVVRAHFRWQGREAVLYNLHLRSFGEEKPWHEDESRWFEPRVWKAYLRQYRSAYRLRAREAEQLRTMIEKETLPVIVVGDFNSTAHNWEYNHLVRGLGDAFMRAGRGWGATYHQRLPFVRIDFVLVSPAFEVLSADVIEDAVLSDHLPLVAKMRWRE